MNADNPEAAITEGLKAEFQTLHNFGSSDKILGTLPTLLALGPIRQMLAVGVPPARAALALLEMAAENAPVHVRAAAAVTGIQPRNIGRGVRNDPGPEQREEKAGEIDGYIGRRAVNGKYRKVYFPAYAAAVLDLVATLDVDETLMMKYQHHCAAPVKRSIAYMGSGPASVTVEHAQSAQNDCAPGLAHAQAFALSARSTDPHTVTIQLPRSGCP